MVLNTESSLDKIWAAELSSFEGELWKSVYRRQRFYANDTNLSLI